MARQFCYEQDREHIVSRTILTASLKVTNAWLFSSLLQGTAKWAENTQFFL